MAAHVKRPQAQALPTRPGSKILDGAYLFFVQALEFAVGLFELVETSLGVVFGSGQGLDFPAIVEHDHRWRRAAGQQTESQEWGDQGFLFHGEALHWFR